MCMCVCVQVFAGYVQESQSRQKLMDKLSSSVKNAQMALMLKDVDPEFSKQSTYFSELCDKMSVLERIGARLHSERESLQMAQDDFSVSLFHWAANEQVLTNPLQKLASCVEHCGHSLKRLVSMPCYHNVGRRYIYKNTQTLCNMHTYSSSH